MSSRAAMGYSFVFDQLWLVVVMLNVMVGHGEVCGGGDVSVLMCPFLGFRYM